jgi:hypothetical protein
MTVFCAVENNRLEHIRFMEDNLKSIAEKIGASYESVKSARSLGLPCYGYKIERVEIDDD